MSYFCSIVVLSSALRYARIASGLLRMRQGSDVWGFCVDEVQIQRIFILSGALRVSKGERGQAA